MNDLTLPSELGAVADKPWEDAGAAARDKLQARKSALQRFWFWTKFWIALALLAIVAGLGYFVYDAYKNRVTQVVTDHRPCSVDVAGEKITGVRDYQYNYFEIFGLRIIDTSKMEITTTIEYKGSDLIVVGRNASGWWSMKTSDGEYGKMKTQPADSYTFITKGGRVKEVDSNVFCK